MIRVDVELVRVVSTDGDVDKVFYITEEHSFFDVQVRGCWSMSRSKFQVLAPGYEALFRQMECQPQSARKLVPVGPSSTNTVLTICSASSSGAAGTDTITGADNTRA